MTDYRKREKGSKCVICDKRVEVGQVVRRWEDESDTHVDCGDPFSLQVETFDDQPLPMVLLDRPMIYVPLNVVTKIPKDSEKELLEASEEMLAAFSEGVAWNKSQREAYTDLHTAVHRFQPILSRFQPHFIR